MAARKTGAEVRTFSADRFEKFRERKGLTRRALSDTIDVTEQTLYSWGTGKTIPNADQVAQLAAALDVELDDFFE